jgi:hypothetical protein
LSDFKNKYTELDLKSRARKSSFVSLFNKVVENIDPNKPKTDPTKSKNIKIDPKPAVPKKPKKTKNNLKDDYEVSLRKNARKDRAAVKMTSKRTQITTSEQNKTENASSHYRRTFPILSERARYKASALLTVI